MATESEIHLRVTIPEPTVILGQELLPLSIGHLLHLDRLELIPPDSPELLISAILVCTREASDIAPTFRDPWLEWKLRVWLFRVSPFRDIDWTEPMEAFGEYVRAGTESPSAIPLHEKKSMGDSGTPFLQHVKATLQARLNYTPTEAINCSFAQAMWDYFSWHEMEGNVEVCDREKRAELKAQADSEHDELIAEAVEQMKKRGVLNAL